MQDAYLRLDKDLERLFNTLDREVGKDNVLIYLFSTGYFTEPKTDTETYKLPGGIFSVKRAVSLLNAFLVAKYGNGAFVDQYANGHIYLSKNLLEEKNLDPVKVAEESRDFLVKMSGVADAYTLADISSLAVSHLEAQRRAIDPKTAGDIILDFNPGWTVVDDSRYPSVNQDNKTTSYPGPGFIMGQGLSPQVIDETVEAVEIAPTLSRIMRIRSPNSAASKPLTLK